jgi:hypothetical protein
MKFDYEYYVQKLELSGEAVVEYFHQELGSVTRYIYLPLDRGPEAIHQKIAEKFPVERFYAYWLVKQNVPSPLPIKGNLSIDFEDFFYTITDEKTGS